MFKHRNLIWILLFICMMILTACSQKTNYATDGPFIVAKHAPAGPDDFRNMFAAVYSIDLEGNLTLATEETDFFVLGEDAPVFETKIDENEVEQIKELLEKHKFWNMPEDVEDRTVQDGGSRYVTVYLEDESKKVGGLNSNHEGFLEISGYIFSLVDRNDYREWHDDMTEHVFKMNP